MRFLGFGKKSAPEVKSPASGAAFSSIYNLPREMTEGLMPSQFYAQRVTRTEAMSVPAVRRSRDLIAGVLATLPVHLHGPDRNEANSPLLDQPEVGVPRTVTMARTFEDILFEGVAWWRITEFAWTGYPSKVIRLDPRCVVVRPDGVVWVDGSPVPNSELIRFDSPTDPLLVSAARAIRTCLLLEAAANRYAEEPMPLTYFSSEDDQDEENVQAILNAWGTARRTRATGYVPNGLTLKTVTGLTPESMQLADSRQHAVLEIARATGIAPEDLGVSITSRTYSNIQQDRIQFLDFTLGAFISAVQDRLSMNDVTPRGYYAKFKFEGFLRTDPLTRYATIRAGLDVGAIAIDEVRALEDKPDLTPEQRAAWTPTATHPALPQAATPIKNGDKVQQSAVTDGLTSFSASGDVVSLTFSGNDVEFKADPETRVVSGLLLPFNVQTSDDRKIRFAADSVTWQKSAVSRVKLDREHDLGQLLGSATKVDSSKAGISAAFKVAKTPAGDEALALAADGALDGLSAVVRINDSIPDPAFEGGTLVTAATLVRATLTADPAFDDARVSAVALSSERTSKMTEAVEQEKPAADVASFTAAVNAFTDAVKTIGQAGGREVVPAGNAVGFSVKEPMVYTFNGQGHSFARDAFNAKANGDVEAAARVAKFQRQVADVQKDVANFTSANGGSIEEFATVNRTVGATVIPPGYRPDLYVGQLFQGRPLTSMLKSGGTLTDATPFTVSRFGSATGFAGAHTEGTNPTDGTLTFGSQITVNPQGVSGLAKVTREMVDASNPGIDMIVVNAMQEQYSQYTEGLVYAELNGANGVGGTITSGQVPSGAYVATATGVGATGAAGVALLDAIRDQIVVYPGRRFQTPDRLALSTEAAQQLAKAKDGQNRPLLPRIGAQNAVGTISTLSQAFDVDGLPGQFAWSMTGNAAGDADTIMWNSNDALVWESPTLNFTFTERNGPAFIEFALFGYFAVKILRPTGFNAIRLTTT